MTETEIWTKWESQVVNGIFPLRRFLGRSNHSVVFLTDCKAQKLANAAIKIIPADPARAEMQLSRWRTAAALTHPHLIRVLDAGRCKLGGHPFLFVVTEYAEQNLAQILPHRALTWDEVREMLIPTLDVLTFLHRQNLVHTQLKPPNFLVVNDQLKLASDTIRAADLVTDADGDIRGLGAIIVEALTQTPAGSDDTSSLPGPVPARFADLVSRCLGRDPSRRPSLSELAALINPATQTLDQPVSAPQPAAPAPAAPAPTAPAPTPSAPIASTQPAAPPQPVAIARPVAAPRSHARAEPTAARAASAREVPPWIIPGAAVALVLLVAIWAGVRASRNHPGSPPPPASAASSAPLHPEPAAVSPPPATPASATPGVLHEEMPAVSRGARESIHGQIKVAVRVTVDRFGNVTAANLEVRGSSQYFARAATDAAKKWKFAPPDAENPHEWLLQFEFSRNGVTGHGVPISRTSRGG